jgi:hypothetical protein
VTHWTFRPKPGTDVWEVGRSRLFELEAVDGFAYLHALLRRPRQGVPVLALYWMHHPPPNVPMDPAGLQPRVGADGVRRPVDFGREIQRHLDPEATERARQNVSQRLRRAREMIRRVDPEIADHLDRCVRPGKIMLYVDDGNPQITWVLE